MVQITEEFKIRLEKAMTMRGYKPIDISKRTGISESTISQYRSGYCKPKDKKLAMIASVLDVNPAWLMGFDVPMDRISGVDASSSSVNVELTHHEMDIMNAYRSASSDTRAAVCAVLGIKGDPAQLTGESSAV